MDYHLEWEFYPKYQRIPSHLLEVIDVFHKKHEKFDSFHNTLKSNEVLKVVEEGLKQLGYQVEENKTKDKKIKVPVLFGRNGDCKKYFEADAYHEENKTVIEVEAGRGYLNNQFLKDLFEACMMQEVQYLVIAVRKIYIKNNKDFENISKFFDTLYCSNRLNLPLNGVLLIGY